MRRCDAGCQLQWRWLLVDQQVSVPLVTVEGGLLRVSIGDSAVVAMEEGAGEAAACVSLPSRPNCLGCNGGFFNYGNALLQGPRTLSRCLLEKGGTRDLAAASLAKQGSHAAEDREPQEQVIATPKSQCFCVQVY
jgi:hypothetical protein